MAELADTVVFGKLRVLRKIRAKNIKDWILYTSSATLSSFDRAIADTSASSFTLTLPSTPSTGDEVHFADGGSNWGTNNLTINGNGNNILGATTFTADVSDQPFSLVYNGTEWKLSTK